MPDNTFVFLPDSLENGKTGYLEGFYKQFDDCDSYFITNNQIPENTNKFIGYISENKKPNKLQHSKTISINTSTNKVTINDVNNKKHSIVKVIYDYSAFKRSEVLHLSENNYGEHFMFLIEKLKDSNYKSSNNGKRSVLALIFSQILLALTVIIKLFDKVSHYVSYSATISHFKENLNIIQLLLSKSSRENQTKLKIWNIIIAKVLDLIIGVVFVKFLFEYEQNILNLIEDIRELIIKNLKELLMYLMGVPIGLKLNYSFNKSLGTFFFYHIALWRIFLYSMQPFLIKYYKFLVLPGLFGFSFQIAMFSDIIAIATFHVYCIYVYAARLFYFQLKALRSLWHLFIGRKYNPLRDRIDSYQYSQHQLFIGTLGFTILLFLLPTTVMYYTVFTTLRLGIFLVDKILNKFRCIINCLPVYIIILWTIKSQKLGGRLQLIWKHKINNSTIFEAKLNTLPLISCIREFNQRTNSRLVVKNLFQSIFTGLLI